MYLSLSLSYIPTCLYIYIVAWYMYLIHIYVRARQKTAWSQVINSHVPELKKKENQCIDCFVKKVINWVKK